MENPADITAEGIASEKTEEKQSSGFVLTGGDLLILRTVLEHRFLDRNQLSRLLQRHTKRLHRRVFKLENRGYLTSVRFPQQKYIYGVCRLGVSTLVGEGMASLELLDERLRTHELTELFLKHEKMIVDIHVALTLSSRSGPVRLAGWQEGRGLYDTVTATARQGTDRLPIRPDAFFSLEDSRRPEGANRAHFALEADRSTSTHVRLQEKFRAYWSYIEQGLHAKKFGVKGFRVLTITLTDERAKNLCSMAAATIPERARKYFLFASLKSFDREDLDPMSDPTCRSARSMGTIVLQPLVPAPNQLQKESAVV